MHLSTLSGHPFKVKYFDFKNKSGRSVQIGSEDIDAYHDLISEFTFH